ncbi:hypothetical protein [uncultured Brachyspira sp.]|uniref:hypothetical protein n=1 Tax=uncultured Brachyspira sp. TaxID=221953 RepID=UPI00261C6408|nr:hypothetical protein [uncultured Brachyspira sp.]
MQKDTLYKLLDHCFNKSSIKEFRKYIKMFHNIDRWILTSDYCFDNKNKFNNVASFLLLPIFNNTNSEYIIPELGRNALYLDEFIELLKEIQKKDIKEIRTVDKRFITLLNSNFYFSFNFFLTGNIKISIDEIRQLLNNIIIMLEMWKCNSCSNNIDFYNTTIKKIKIILNDTNKTTYSKKLLINMIIIIKLASYITMILVREHPQIKSCLFISDRDNMTTCYDRIFYYLFEVYRHDVCNYYVKEKNYKLDNILITFDNNNFDANELIRIPDFFCWNTSIFRIKHWAHRRKRKIYTNIKRSYHKK